MNSVIKGGILEVLFKTKELIFDSFCRSIGIGVNRKQKSGFFENFGSRFCDKSRGNCLKIEILTNYFEN